MAQLAYVHSVAGLDDYVYDGRMRWNLFRKDTDYVWLLFAPHDTALEAMRLPLNYRFDPYEQIARYKPKVISDELIDVTNPRIAAHSEPAPLGYEGMYVRRAARRLG